MDYLISKYHRLMNYFPMISLNLMR